MRHFARSVALAVLGLGWVTACSAPEFQELPSSGGSAGTTSGGATSGGSGDGATSGGSGGSGATTGGSAGSGALGGSGGVGAGSGGVAASDAGTACPGPPGASTIEAKATSFGTTKIPASGGNGEVHISFNPKGDGHFTAGLADFKLKIADFGASTATRSVLQLRNVAVTNKPEDPGCFFAMLVNPSQVVLSLCGHATPPMAVNMPWKPGTTYDIAVTYDTSGNVSLLVKEGPAQWAIVTHTTGSSIYNQGGGLIIQVGGEGPGSPRLAGTEISGLTVTLTPGAPYCPGYPFK